MRRLVIFDLDGTLLDTAPGIAACYNETAARFGRAARERACFQGIIGGSLKSGFAALYGIEGDAADEAVARYRALYAEKGMYMYSVYPGIPELLASLREQGARTAVATLKLERFAVDMLRHAGLSFDAVFGAGLGAGDAGLTKARLLQKAMDHCGASPDQTVLVGDSAYDAQGAREAGTGFVAVTYGWGFADAEDAARGYHTAIADSADEVAACLAD